MADPAESISRNAMFGLGVKLAGALFTGGLTVFLVRALDPSGYGVFALALSIGSLVLLFSDFGISQSAARFVAERRGRDSEVGHVLSDALSLKLAASVAVSVALAALAGPIADAYGNEDLVWPLRLIAVAVLGQSVLSLFAGSFEALGRNSLGFRLALSESATETAASVALVLAGGGAAGAAGGRAIGYATGAAIAFVLAARLISPGRIRPGRSARWGYRPIAAYAGALLIIEGAYAVYTELDTLMIGAILSTTAAGYFAAPLKLLIFAEYGGLALAAGIAPRLAQHPDHPPNAGALQAGLRLLLVLQLAMVPPVIIWAEPLVDLVLGPDYGPSVEAMQYLAPFVALSGLAPLLALSVNYIGEARRRIPLAIATVAINAGLDLWLINELGIKGASIATDVAIAFYVAGHLWICARLVELDLASLALTLARAGLAAAAMAAVLLAFGSGELSLAQLLGGGALALGAYGGALVATREISSEELRAARRAAARLRRR